MRNEKIKKLCVLAMLCALSYATTFLFHLLGISFVPMVPFLTYDPKDIIIVIGGFLYGPLAAAGISVVVSTLELVTISGTGLIGWVMNILSTCAFACSASYIYKKYHSLGGSIVGLVTGVLLMILTMLGWNYLITPLYMDIARSDIATMLIPAFLPFNLLKGGLNATVTALLYRPLVQSLRLAGLFPKSTAKTAPNRAGKLLFYLITALLLALCITVIFLLK